MRTRNLDPSKPMTIYDSTRDDLPDRIEPGIVRTLNSLPTGMEKDEELVRTLLTVGFFRSLHCRLTAVYALTWLAGSAFFSIVFWFATCGMECFWFERIVFLWCWISTLTKGVNAWECSRFLSLFMFIWPFSVPVNFLVHRLARNMILWVNLAQSLQ